MKLNFLLHFLQYINTCNAIIWINYSNIIRISHRYMVYMGKLLLDRSIRLKKLVSIKCDYGKDILMNKRPNLIISLHKTGALCWEADAIGVKSRILFAIFKTPQIRNWGLWLKCCTEAAHRLFYFKVIIYYI